MVESKFSLRYFYFFPLFLIVFDTLIAYGLLQSNHSIHAKDVLFIILVLSARKITGLIGNLKPADAIVIKWGKRIGLS